MLGSTLRKWWDRLHGRESPAAPSGARRNRPAGTLPAQPAADPGELQIADDRGAPPAGKAQHTGAAGFDPYSSDAGYQKPHGWERLDHD